MENQELLTQAESWPIARDISYKLGEKGPSPIYQISTIIRYCGVEFAQAVLKDTLELEAQGGMMLPDNSRRRTPGGVFFLFVRQRVESNVADRLFSRKSRTARKAEREKRREENLQKLKAQHAAKKALDAANREANGEVEIVKSRILGEGEVGNVKITLVGRPGKIETHQDLIITKMTQQNTKTLTLPKGVPALPSTPTVYTVYIGFKQWQKVKEAIANPEDSLIIEGICAIDPNIKGIAVYTASISTRLLDMKRREEQKSAAAGADGTQQTGKEKPGDKEKSKSEKVENAAPVIPPGMPPDEAQKLTGLYASAALFRQKIETIQAKPAEQQSGLEMTQKLLKGVVDQITALEKKYV